MMALKVVEPGSRTTVQDLGRNGYQHQGLSPGGAADLHAFRWANQLLDNPANAACLEITLGGFSATAMQRLLLAITGADCRPSVNGSPISNWGVFLLEPGDRLRLDIPGTGLLSYLAVTGGWQTRMFCGSRSCVVREGLEGLGRLSAGTELPASPPSAHLDLDHHLKRVVPEYLRTELDSDRPLKLVPGPEYDTFSAIDRARLLGSRYSVDTRSDRMAYRLDGPALASPGGITSRAVCCGTVQIPGDGKPMVMLNDRQTIGGYPVIGTVPGLDCARLAQKRPGQTVAFTLADVADCQSERMLFEQLMKMTVWTSSGEPAGKA